MVVAEPGQYQWPKTLVNEWEVWDREVGDPYK
jgi:hypothetical protein